jgi:hypothetical protein
MIDTTNKGLVLRKFPEAMLARITTFHFEIVVPSDDPSEGWCAHKALGTGSSPKKAWATALQTIASTNGGDEKHD